MSAFRFGVRPGNNAIRPRHFVRSEEADCDGSPQSAGVPLHDAHDVAQPATRSPNRSTQEAGSPLGDPPRPAAGRGQHHERGRADDVHRRLRSGHRASADPFGALHARRAPSADRAGRPHRGAHRVRLPRRRAGGRDPPGRGPPARRQAGRRQDDRLAPMGPVDGAARHRRRLRLLRARRRHAGDPAALVRARRHGRRRRGAGRVRSAARRAAGPDPRRRRRFHHAAAGARVRSAAAAGPPPPRRLRRPPRARHRDREATPTSTRSAT